MAQSGYPTKPVRMIIPYPPGGSNDIMGRLVSQKLSEGLGVTIVVDNRGGGNGIIGTEALVRAAPDGHTILVASINSHLLTSLMTTTPYDPIKDFTVVGTIDSSDYLMVVHPGVAANSLQEFIALAKAKPGQLNYASSTTSVLVTTAMFIARTGIKLQHVPYKGAGPALNDLLGGHVQMFFSTPSSMVTHVKNGKVKPIAVTAETRLQALPTVPTFAESGVAGFRRESAARHADAARNTQGDRGPLVRGAREDTRDARHPGEDGGARHDSLLHEPPGVSVPHTAGLREVRTGDQDRRRGRRALSSGLRALAVRLAGPATLSRSARCVQLTVGQGRHTLSHKKIKIHVHVLNRFIDRSASANESDSGVTGLSFVSGEYSVRPRATDCEEYRQDIPG